MSGRPAPGSDKAVAWGCTCPRMDNSYGAGIGGGEPRHIDGSVMYWINGDCELHGRTGAWEGEEADDFSTEPEGS